MLRAYLSMRVYFGWGSYPEVLRLRGLLWMRSYIKTVVLLATVLAILFGIRPFVDPHVLRLPPMAMWVRIWMGIGTLYLLFIGAVIVFPGIVGLLLGRKQDAMRTRTVYGRCFAVIISQPDCCFALIGLSHERSHWYVLPIDWDEDLDDRNAELELVVNAGTEWVERLRRLGESPVERIQLVPDLTAFRTSQQRQLHEDSLPFNLHEEDGAVDTNQATDDEKRILKNFARRQPLRWRATPTNIAINGWTALLGGTILGPGFVGVLPGVLTPRYPQSFSGESSRPAIIVLVLVLLSIGLVLIALGLLMLRSWSHVRRSRLDVPVSVEGEVQYWMPYKDMWSPIGARSSNSDIRETLISIAVPDGQSRIFRIPVKFMHRVRLRGRWVRIQFLPATERVQLVAPIENPKGLNAHSPQNAPSHPRP